MNKVKAGISGAIVFASIIVWCVPAQAANLVNDVVGIEDASEEVAKDLISVIESARRAARAVVGDLDTAAEARIDQIDRAVGVRLSEISALAARTTESVNGLLRLAITDVKRLESSFFAQVRSSIRKFECTSTRLMNEEASGALGALGRALGTHTIILEPIIEPQKTSKWMGWIEVPREKKISLRDAEKAYAKIRQYHLRDLNKLTDNDTPINQILAVYRRLAMSSRWASCHYPETDLKFIEDHARFVSLYNDWVTMIPSIERQPIFRNEI